MKESQQAKKGVHVRQEEMQFREGSLLYKEGCVEIQPCHMKRRLWLALCTCWRPVTLGSRGHSLTVSRGPAKAFM